MPTAAKDIFRQPGVPMRAGRPLDLTPGAIVPAHAAALIKAAQMRQARLRPQPQGPGAGRPRDGHLIQRPIHIARPVPAHLLPGVQTGPTVYPVAPEPPQELPYVDSGTSGGLSGGLSGDFTEGQTLADDDQDDIGATADDQGLITDSGALLADADSDTALEPSEYADQPQTAVERGIFDRLYGAYQSGQLTLDSDGDNTTGGQNYSFDAYGYDYGNQGGVYYGYYGDYGSGTAARYGLYGAGAQGPTESPNMYDDEGNPLDVQPLFGIMPESWPANTPEQRSQAMQIGMELLKKLKYDWQHDTDMQGAFPRSESEVQASRGADADTQSDAAKDYFQRAQQLASITPQGNQAQSAINDLLHLLVYAEVHFIGSIAWGGGVSQAAPFASNVLSIILVIPAWVDSAVKAAYAAGKQQGEIEGYQRAVADKAAALAAAVSVLREFAVNALKNLPQIPNIPKAINDTYEDTKKWLEEKMGLLAKYAGAGLGLLLLGVGAAFVLGKKR